VVDDTVLTSFKWQVAGGEAVVKFVEGAPHAFFLFPIEQFEHALLPGGMQRRGFDSLRSTGETVINARLES
jgi:hypothetical protein